MWGWIEYGRWPDYTFPSPSAQPRRGDMAEATERMGWRLETLDISGRRALWGVFHKAVAIES